MTSPMQSDPDPRTVKQLVRRLGELSRALQADKDELSWVICGRFAALPEYVAAATVMLYVHMRDEVRTQPFLPLALAQKRRVVVPFCAGENLELFHLESPGELEIGTFGILEPRPSLRGLAERKVRPEEVDLVMVPGVAFDRRGGRAGHGKGYYDRLLRQVRPDATLVGVAYECQLVPEVPMLEHDVFMDAVITEKGIYPGRGRRSQGTGP